MLRRQLDGLCRTARRHQPLADPQALDSVGKGSNTPSIDDMNLTDPDERRATSIVLLIDQFNEHYEDWSRGDCRDEQGISIFSQCAVHTLSLSMSSSMIDKTLDSILRRLRKWRKVWRRPSP